MKVLLAVALCFCGIAFILAECPNACSGHGSCGQFDQCDCCFNWQGADCSERTCPFGQAFADVPKGDLDGSTGALSGPGTSVIVGSTTYPYGTTEQFPNSQDNEGHFYAECSAKGICNREEGLCECFTAYEGTACQRASCPNDCSGHGTCETIKELSEDKEDGDDYDVLDWSGIGNLKYELWDRHKTLGCKCDSLYEGPDCSLKKCPLGVDPLYRGVPKYEESWVEIYSGSNTDMTGTFDLVIYDNLGTKYVLDGLKYAHYDALHNKDGDGNQTFSTCDEIMAYFPNDRIQDTVIGTVTYPFCTAMTPRIGTYGIRYRFDYKKGNPGYHKDLYVQSYTPNDPSEIDHEVMYYTETQGMDALYEDSDTYDLTLPGYVLDAVEGAYVFNASTDLSQFLHGNTSFPNDTDTSYIQIEGVEYIVDKVELVDYDVGGPATHITTKISQITLEGALQLPNAHNIVSGAPTKYPILAKLTTEYQYVDHCAGRGLCNQETGLCECFSGYKTTICDTQAPQC